MRSHGLPGLLRLGDPERWARSLLSRLPRQRSRKGDLDLESMLAADLGQQMMGSERVVA